MRRFGSLGAVFGLLAVVALGGCSDSDDSDADTQPYVDAIAANLSTAGIPDDEISEDDMNCLAGKWVQAVKVSSFEDAGVTPDDIANSPDGPFTDLDLDEAQANGIFDAFQACGVDPREAMMDEGEMTPEVEECLDEVLSGDRFRKFMIATLTLTEEELESDPELAETFEGLMACAFLGMADDGWDMDDFDMDMDMDMDVDMDEVEFDFDFDFDEDA